jgi:hypothetical protein
MFCETYNQSLTDAAASGELSPALRGHLDACESCHAAFEEEQSLYAAIDAGLQFAANSDASATLIPRILVAFNNEPAPQRDGFSFLVWGAAGGLVTVALVLAFLYLPHDHTPPVESPQAVPAAATENSASPPALNPLEPRGVFPVQHKKTVVLVANQNPMPEQPQVLVPPSERDALLRYEELLRKTSAAGNQVAPAKSLDMSQDIEPLGIAELDLGDLRILALPKPALDGQARQ